MNVADLLENLQTQKLLFDQPKYKAIYDMLVREVEEYNEQVKEERIKEVEAEKLEARETAAEVIEEQKENQPKAIPSGKPVRRA